MAEQRYQALFKAARDAIFIINRDLGVIIDVNVAAERIIGHVSKGAEIGRKKNLPKVIIDFVQTHHGTTSRP